MENYTTIHYHNYLELDKLLSAQNLRSEALGAPAHEEMLFIVVHQVYELWFKQIVHELSSVITFFDENRVDERSVGEAVARLARVSDIQKLLIEQIGVMETMTPLDFLDFRHHLFPASGFQSFQFRLIETLLGLEEDQRMTYNGQQFSSVFAENQRQILRGVGERTLFRVVEAWLERTPFLSFGDFDFLTQYRAAVTNMLEKERIAIENSPFLQADEKKMRLQMLGSTDGYFNFIFDPATHAEHKAQGRIKLSYQASIAALLITLYHDEPILNQPFALIQQLINLDENMTTWRYRHAQMVRRMLGKKVGTGGSSGFDYLAATAEKHIIFGDFHNLSTLLIPRSALPPLPNDVRRALGFYFSKVD